MRVWLISMRASVVLHLSDGSNAILKMKAKQMGSDIICGVTSLNSMQGEEIFCFCTFVATQTYEFLILILTTIFV